LYLMARASKEQAETHHRLVIENSAKLMLERGIDGVSVADLMESAGLTHGGFYGHFDSKEQLAAEACAHAFENSVAKWTKRVAGAATPAEGFKAIVEGYMSTRNRDNAGTSCPTPALMADVARESASSEVRARYREGVNRLLDVLQSVEPTDDAGTGRQRAMAQFSMMVGALALARATAGNSLSDEFLDSAREALLGEAESNRRPVSRRGKR
jgi:TetR/AcrR family transcriptional regulator, transcriptional repressor for nem operon